MKVEALGFIDQTFEGALRDQSVWELMGETQRSAYQAAGRFMFDHFYDDWTPHVHNNHIAIKLRAENGLHVVYRFEVLGDDTITPLPN